MYFKMGSVMNASTNRNGTDSRNFLCKQKSTSSDIKASLYCQKLFGHLPNFYRETLYKERE